MSKLDLKHQSYLKNEFGNRVSFSKTERKLYGHESPPCPVWLSRSSATLSPMP